MQKKVKKMIKFCETRFLRISATPQTDKKAVDRLNIFLADCEILSESVRQTGLNFEYSYLVVECVFYVRGKFAAVQQAVFHIGD